MMKDDDHWSQTPPACLGDFWWWDGDEEHRPVAVDVHVEMDGVFYARGNHGFEESMEVGVLGGWWYPLKAPEIPLNDPALTPARGKPDGPGR
jgi:hypothetical protein